MGWLIAGCGAFAICGGLFDWDWFMDNHRARPMVKLLGRSGTRIFYVVLGLGLIGLGVALALGYIEDDAR